MTDPRADSSDSLDWPIPSRPKHRPRAKGKLRSEGANVSVFRFIECPGGQEPKSKAVTPNTSHRTSGGAANATSTNPHAAFPTQAHRSRGQHGCVRGRLQPAPSLALNRGCHSQSHPLPTPPPSKTASLAAGRHSRLFRDNADVSRNGAPLTAGSRSQQDRASARTTLFPPDGPSRSGRPAAAFAVGLPLARPPQRIKEAPP